MVVVRCGDEGGDGCVREGGNAIGGATHGDGSKKCQKNARAPAHTSPRQEHTHSLMRLALQLRPSVQRSMLTW